MRGPGLSHNPPLLGSSPSRPSPVSSMTVTGGGSAAQVRAVSDPDVSDAQADSPVVVGPGLRTDLAAEPASAKWEGGPCQAALMHGQMVADPVISGPPPLNASPEARGAGGPPRRCTGRCPVGGDPMS